MLIIAFTAAESLTFSRNLYSDVLVCVPRDLTQDIQEGRHAIYHALCPHLEERFFGL